MKYKKEAIEEIYLLPGQILVSDRPAVVRTILGSCISVTMFSARLEIGSICHALLSDRCGENSCYTGSIYRCPYGGFTDESFKYLNCSIRYMLENMAMMGIVREELEVKVFGGADVLDLKREGSNTLSVGRNNIETAMRILRGERINLKTQDVGGEQGRKIIFFPHTGEVFVKKLAKTNSRKIITTQKTFIVGRTW
jgi:chemotaxis protein CheD